MLRKIQNNTIKIQYMPVYQIDYISPVSAYDGMHVLLKQKRNGFCKRLYCHLYVYVVGLWVGGCVHILTSWFNVFKSILLE